MDEDTRIVRRTSAPGPTRRGRRGRAAPGPGRAGRPQRRRFSIGRLILLVVIVVAVVVVGAGIGVLAAVTRTLPSLDEIGAPRPRVTSFLYSTDGQVVAELHRTENRVPVEIEQVPKHVQDAVIAAEDHRFWEHRGMDPIRIFRAILADLRTRSFSEGASTITQQIVKNAFTGPQKTITRKLQDIILAVEMERRYTKPELLEMYLNIAFFGHDAYGVQSAARTYFGKDVGQLTLAEGALVAGLIRSPNAYSPYVDPATARQRQHLVLDAMVKYGLCGAADAGAAKAEELTFAGLKDLSSYDAPHFTDYVVKQLIARYGEEAAFEGGLKVYTTIDMRMQKAAEKAVHDVLDPVFPLKPDTEQPEAAVVIIDPTTGQIKAMVGGRAPAVKMEWNRAVDSLRQPGSAFKPIIAYAPAIDLGFSPASIVDDAPLAYLQPDGKVWAPTNYDLKNRGLTTLREGLQWSINVMAVRLLEKIGVQTGLDYAQKLGISSLATSGRLNDGNLATALGGLTNGVSPLEMVSAFGVFANSGVRSAPLAILKVVDKDGNVLEENEAGQSVVLHAETAYIITDMLRSVVEAGTGQGARLTDRPAAGKTGTTSDNVDAWFVGYVPGLVGGVWMGHDQPREMEAVWGSTYPAQVWRAMMTAILKGTEPSWFDPPRGIISGITVCAKSGQRPGPLCPPNCVRTEMFARGTQPHQTCTVHVQADICDASGLLATPQCPPWNVQTKICIKRSEPWAPYTDEKGRTFTPLDAVDEAPTAYCNVHGTGGPADGTGDAGGNGTGGTGDGVATKVFDVQAQCFAFNPAQIHVRVGETVLLRVTAIDVQHGFKLPDFGVDVLIPAGETRACQFVADRAGIFPFYCGVPCGAGCERMVGQLIVEQ